MRTIYSTFGGLLKAARGLGTHLAKTVDTLRPVAVLIDHRGQRCRNAGRVYCMRAAALRSD